MDVALKATVMWAYLDKVNDLSGKYQLDLCHLSDKAVAALESSGIKVLSKDDKGSYITCKSARVIKAFDSQGQEIEGSTLGNGSECVATVTPYEWKFKAKTGVSPSLKKLKITKLVEYSGGEGGADVDEDEVL